MEKTELLTVGDERAERCETCRFYEGNAGRRGRYPECRRRAPLPVTTATCGATFVFPSIEYDGWCGEWQGNGIKEQAPAGPPPEPPSSLAPLPQFELFLDALDTRVISGLANAKIASWADLLDQSFVPLQTKNLGPVSLLRIISAMHKLGVNIPRHWVFSWGVTKEWRVKIEKIIHTPR